eukprot:g18544.t1
MLGGDLFDIAAKLGDPGIEREQQIYPIVVSLMQAVRALHVRGIAHGDISLENALLRYGSQVVLIDFAMAVTENVEAATGHRGKPSYMAPEMFVQRNWQVRAACTCDLLPINDENFNIPQIQYNVSQHVVALIVVLEIWLFNRVFRVLSLTMTRWENHKLRSDFVHAYHLKAVSLQLINSYASLFYIAFYPDSLKMFEVSYTCSYANGWWNHWGNACRMARLNKQLTTILAAFCLKVAFRCVALLLFSPTKKASQSSDILDLDHVMSAPRFGDPETDLNVVPSCCFSAASEVIIVLGMFLLFLPASPWTGLLTFIFLQLSNLALARSRRGIPWRAGHPFCHSADLLEASDRLAGTAIQAISWLAMLSMAALLVWPAQLGWGRLNAVLLINEGSDLAPWGVSCALLLVCRFLPGRFVQCTPTAARLRTAETRLCRAMQKARQDGTAAPSIRSVRGRPQLGTDFRVRTPQQWEELSANLESFTPLCLQWPLLHGSFKCTDAAESAIATPLWPGCPVGSRHGPGGVQHRRAGGLPEAEVAQLMEQMFRATLHCHQRNTLHRDLKPENFLFTGAEGSSDVKLIDFGFAVQDGTWSAENKYDGTLLYASPEQLKGAQTAKSDDVWSLGVIFHILLTAADLAKQLLAWDASDRISLEAALEHPFLAPASSGSQSLLSAQEQLAQGGCMPCEFDLCNRLDRFVDSCRLQQLAQTAIAHMLGECRKDGALARATFVELERLGDGEATTIALSHFLQMHGIQPTAEWLGPQIKYKITLFDLLDSDGDGLISIEDLRSGLNLSLEDSTEVISEALGELRRKGKKETSGSITFWNFLHLLEPAPLPAAEEARAEEM